MRVSENELIGKDWREEKCLKVVEVSLKSQLGEESLNIFGCPEVKEPVAQNVLFQRTKVSLEGKESEVYDRILRENHGGCVTILEESVKDLKHVGLFYWALYHLEEWRNVSPRNRSQVILL